MVGEEVVVGAGATGNDTGGDSSAGYGQGDAGGYGLGLTFKIKVGNMLGVGTSEMDSKAGLVTGIDMLMAFVSAVQPAQVTRHKINKEKTNSEQLLCFISMSISGLLRTIRVER